MNDDPAKWERLDREIYALKELIEAATPDALQSLFARVKRGAETLFPLEAPDRDWFLLANVEKSFVNRINDLADDAKRQGQLTPEILSLEDFGADIEDWFQSQTEADMGPREFRYRYGADNTEGLGQLPDSQAAQTPAESRPDTKPSPRNNVEEDDTPDAYLQSLRSEGIEAPAELAVRLKARFPGLSDYRLGGLLPANPGNVIGYDAIRDRGRRLLGKK